MKQSTAAIGECIQASLHILVSVYNWRPDGVLVLKTMIQIILHALTV